MKNLFALNSTSRTVCVSLLSSFAAFFVGAVIVLFIGDDPIAVFRVFLEHSFLSLDGLGYSLFYTTPLLFTSMSVAFAFRCGLFNVGSEGQLYMGTMATTIVALSLPDLSPFLLIPLLFCVAFFVGGVWGAIPGYLKVRYGAHEVINTIMLNLIAYGICNYLVVGPYKRQGDQILETEYISANAQIFRLNKIFPFFDEDLPINAALLVALFLLVVYWFFFKKTTIGYGIRAVGSSPKVAEYAGIAAGRYTVLSMFIAGGLSGLVALHEVLGYRYTFHDNFSRGIGFMGIAVALLGRNHPLGILLAAFLFGALTRGSLFLDIEFENLSNDLVVVLQGVIILFVGMHGMFEKWLPTPKN